MITWLDNNWWWIVGASILIIAIIAIVILWVRLRKIRFIYRVFGGCPTIKYSCSAKTVRVPEWHKVLQEELNRLPIGKIVFNPPDVMKVGVKDRIETRITRDINANLLTSLKGRGIPKTEELKISELMKVRLSGCDFNIIPLNEEEQVIEGTGFTEWAWDVSPQRSGKKVLHLHVTLRIRLPYGEERKDHPVLDREIVVKVNPAYSLKTFIVSYWKWIVTALILPLIGLAWKIYTK